MTAHDAALPSNELTWLVALREPERALGWSLGEWEVAVRMSRRLRLLARLAATIDAAGLTQQVPTEPRRHLVGEARLSQSRLGAMRWGLERVAAVLDGASYLRVLLKGAAYAAQGLPIAAGRLPSDLDILVPAEAIGDARQRLAAAGWQEAALDAHDQRYYEQWSHELPPMRHPLLAIELDVHHTILPPVSRTPVDAGRLLERLSAVPSPAGWHVLDPADQALHSAAHLFLDSEGRDRLRDLVDLDGLLRHFGTGPGFWPRLVERSRELGLAEPLALGVHFCRAWLGTPIPPESLRAVEAQGPSALRRAWLLPLLATVLRPAALDRRPAQTQSAAAALFTTRYHWHRLPPRLLLPHLWHKLRSGGEPLGPTPAPVGQEREA